MSLPRQILPGTTYLVIRRCAEQRFFLRPSRRSQEIFRYCLAVAAARTGVQLHAFCVMSNHWHAVLSDPYARLPEFMAYVHKYVAKALNGLLQRKENLWSSEPYHAVVLESRTEVLDKMVYVLANPVQARLVRRAAHWPGVHSAAMTSDTVQHVKRPAWFFRPEGPMPAEAVLQLTLPPQVDSTNPATFWQELQARVRERELQCEQDKGPKVLGIIRILRLSPFQGPKMLQRRWSNRLAIAGKTKQVQERVRKRLKEFHHHYREAYLAFRQGIREVLFPAGTYLLRVQLQVHCEPVAG